jgi:hydantoinase/carbamoylase family amidase
MPSNLSVDGDRLWRTIEASSAIGRGPNGGLRRLTLTDEDKEVRDLLVRWAGESAFAVRIDQLGNMFVRREGEHPELPPVLIGSHLDTQAAGGRFDGILGVLGGLEVLRTLEDSGIATRRAIEVVNWTNEEGARFYPPMLSSLVFSGKESVRWAEDRTDKAGVRLGDELARIGYCGDAAVGNRPIDAYFELHIEQGPKLDAAGIPVGIVTGGFPTRGMRIDIVGETAHVAQRQWSGARMRSSALRTWLSPSTRSAGAIRPVRARRRPLVWTFGRTCPASLASAQACSATCGIRTRLCWSTWSRISRRRCLIAPAAAAVPSRWPNDGASAASRSTKP